MVCASCGLVQTLAPVNVQPEVQLGVSTSSSGFERKASFARGIPRRMLDSSSSLDASRSPYLSDLQHWNAYVHLSEDDLAMADRRLRVWMQDGMHYLRDRRMLAVLLWPQVSPLLLCEEDIRSRILAGTSIPVMRSTEPDARFACEACGRRFHSLKSARYHCKLRIGNSAKRMRR